MNRQNYFYFRANIDVGAIFNISLSVWLMMASGVLNVQGTARTNGVIAGALAATFATIAVWEATRGLRWLNLLIGVWLLVAPLIFGFETPSLVNSIIIGILMIILATIKGEIKERLGGAV